jgi:hypothetical protein
MGDLIVIAVSLALAAYYVVRLFKFIPAAQQSRNAAATDLEVQGDHEDMKALR